MISRELELCRVLAGLHAKELRHEYVTLEHLLLALLDAPSVSRMFRFSLLDIEKLREPLAVFIGNIARVEMSKDFYVTPTEGFNRVIERASMHVRAMSYKNTVEVLCLHVLVAFFGEKDSFAGKTLKEYGITRRSLVNYITQNHSLGERKTIFSPESEESLYLVFDKARHFRHGLADVEHLLLALLDNQRANEALKACLVDIDMLRAQLIDFLKEKFPEVYGNEDFEPQATDQLKRVIQRAIMVAQSATRLPNAPEIHGVDILVSVFAEKDSRALYLLHNSGVTQLDLTRFILSGSSKSSKHGEKLLYYAAPKETVQDFLELANAGKLTGFLLEQFFKDFAIEDPHKKET